MIGPGQEFHYQAKSTMLCGLNKRLLFKFSLFFSLLFLNYCNAQVYQSVNEVPNPKITGQENYIADPANVLQRIELDSINQIINDLDAKTGIEVAVVIVNDFNKDQDDFTFATALFRKWGIGKKQANNGLLLFVTINRKKYRFITGYGLEGLLPDADLETIAKHKLVPDFKKQQYGPGIILVLNTIAAYLEQPVNHKEVSALLHNSEKANLNWVWYLIPLIVLVTLYAFAVSRLKQNKPQLSKSDDKGYNRYELSAIYTIVVSCIAAFAVLVLFAVGGGYQYIYNHFLQLLPFICYVIFAVLLYVRYLNVLGALRKKYLDDRNFNTAVKAFQQSFGWYVVLSPLLVFRMRKDSETIEKENNRFEKAPADKRGNPMFRINRDENRSGAPYLSKGQQAEESKRVYHYDIWINSNNEVKLIANEAENFAMFDHCIKCGFKTLAKPTTAEIIKATTKREGKEKTIRVCNFCNYEEIISESLTPVLDFSSGTSGSSNEHSSSSDSSSSSSSSGSGSWGGGSTGGGGAGGSW